MMSFFKVFLITAVSAGLVFPAGAQTPETDPESDPSWQVCNETSFILRLATALQKDKEVVPSGWTRLRPGGCTSVDAPPDVPRYVYAESSVAHQGGIREWKGSVPFCIDQTDFVANPSTVCALQDMETRAYIAIDPRDPVTRFVEPDSYGKKAQAAGIQRLLRDNGQKISKIDGLVGRRTTRTLNKFLSSLKVPADLSPEQQIDQLEQAALEHLKTVGLTICNTTERNVWAATARRHNETWKSQGWWRLEPKACVQAVTEDLTGLDVHYFARQEVDGQDADNTLRASTTSEAKFCISDSRFSALGRDNCSDKGYKPANFRLATTEKSGETVNLSEADFSANVTGLRR
jgi:uncharacterized membrane protein